MEGKDKVFIGSDHAGFKLKEQIKEYLAELGVDYEDLGNHELDPHDDYPDYALKVAEKVAETKSRGILICDSGVGVCIVANKVKGIRAVNAGSVRIAEMSRRHNNTNVLCLGQDYVTVDEAKDIVKAWLETEFSSESRHHRRVDKITRIENG
jgi:RpiB/LacA/LacB family sugar-phosphate isomerase